MIIKKIHWFTETKINYVSKSDQIYHFKSKTIELTRYLNVFKEKKLWEKKKYRDEYNDDFSREDLEKIISIKINIHNNIDTFSNLHNYEKLIKSYIKDFPYSKDKILASGISEASKIAVIEVDYSSKHEIINNLTFEEEKNIDNVFNNLNRENINNYREQNRIKSIIAEFIQFLNFNLYLNYQTQDYSFTFTKKPNPVGLIIYSNGKNLYYEVNKTELLNHYVLYEKEYDLVEKYMDITSLFWCEYNNSIHFFIDALKGSYITSSNFIKLVFTFESFFSKNTSNDFMSLTVPIIISRNISEMKMNREIIKKCFALRNEIVHGSKLHDINNNEEMEDLFYKLKNLILRVFGFLINNENLSKKINHELLFTLLPKGLNK